MSEIRVLIVEDDPIIAAEIATCLNRLDYTISGKCYTASKAFAELQNNPPDIALLDINLNGKLDGIELAKYIRQNLSIPFIFLTSYADKATLEAIKPTEPEGYIVKPFTEKDILVNLEIALSKHANRQSAQQEKPELENLNQYLSSPLTLREYELLLQLLEGKTNRQIAADSFVSINTVKTHLKNLFSKLNVTTRTAAAFEVQKLLKQT